MLFIAKQDSMMSGNSEFNEAWRWSRNQCMLALFAIGSVSKYAHTVYMIEIMSYDAQRRFMVKVRQLVSYVKNMNVWNVDRRKRVIPGSRLIIAFHKTSES